MANSRLCSIPECGKPSDRKGLCCSHYMRARRNNGNPEGGRTPPGMPLDFIRKAANANTASCILWPFSVNTRTGYGEIDYNGVKTTAHRASLIEATGVDHDRHMHAAHLPQVCHNKTCINPRHLRWATREENEADKLKDGTRPLGERHFRSVFSADQVRRIRADKRPLRTIAEELGVSVTPVHTARRGASYKDVE